MEKDVLLPGVPARLSSVSETGQSCWHPWLEHLSPDNPRAQGAPLPPELEGLEVLLVLLLLGSRRLAVGRAASLEDRSLIPRKHLPCEMEVVSVTLTSCPVEPASKLLASRSLHDQQFL